MQIIRQFHRPDIVHLRVMLWNGSQLEKPAAMLKSAKQKLVTCAQVLGDVNTLSVEKTLKVSPLPDSPPPSPLSKLLYYDSASRVS
jgi:hypothetical protein